MLCDKILKNNPVTKRSKMEKTKKSRLTIAMVLLLIVIVMATTLAGCASPKKKSLKISMDNKYDESVFAGEVAKQKEGNVSFANGGVCNYIIYYPDEIDNLTFLEGKVKSSDRYKVELKNTVKFFAESIKKIVGSGDIVYLPISKEVDGAKIVLKVDENLENVNNQGYFLKIESNKITISGKTLQGISNGIYSFLEESLGCMFVAQDYDYLPSLPTVNFASGEKTFNPAFMWRNVYAYESERNLPKEGDGSDYLGWSSKLKLNGAANDDWGNWCHTFYAFIPPAEYFESHPEYFSEYNGKRAYESGPVSGQLCLTNEDVYNIISTKLFDNMAKNPDLHYWDVSQMDTWINRGKGCQCKNCKALDDKEDSPMGSLLTFINRLADECAEKFPNNFISTLAYNYSAKPPKTLVPRDNVLIKLCLMPGDSASDYKNPTSSDAKKAAKIVEQWGKIAKHIIIWDYNVDFHKYLMPFPILTPLKANNDFYLENNVYGIFHQMDRDKGGDNAEMNAYLFSKLMWDKDTDVEKTISKYLTVYYGKASEKMAEYYNTLNENLYESEKNLYIYSKVWMHSSDYLSVANTNKYLKILNEAEQSVIGDEVITKRIKKAKIGALYVKAEQFSCDTKDRLAALEEMRQICIDNGINSLYEGQKEGVDELEVYYTKQIKNIKAAPGIMAGIVLGTVAIVAGIGVGGVMSYKKHKRKKMAAIATENEEK